MNREELDLHRQELDLLDALTAAKEAHRAKPSDDTRAALNEAKQAIRAFRAEWRSIRDAFAGKPTDGDGVAQPTTIKADTKVRS
jgi:hypothetical protein